MRAEKPAFSLFSYNTSEIISLSYIKVIAPVLLLSKKYRWYICDQFSNQKGMRMENSEMKLAFAYNLQSTLFKMVSRN